MGLPTKRRLVLALATLCLSASAFGQDAPNMHLLGEDEKGVRWLLRTDRHTPTAIGRTVWVYVHLRRPGPIYRPPAKGPNYLYSVNQWHIDCRHNKFALGQASYYDAKNEVVSSDGGNPYSFKDPTPDTWGDAVVRTTCDPIVTPFK